MNFITFPVGSTNIFPHSNSKTGGQNITEWNLRCRDMVSTSSIIDYEVGPSYVHGVNDYEVRVYQDSTGTIISSSTLEIMPGKGVINGHYIETLTPMLIDLLDANIKLKNQAMPQLKGELTVGIRVFYSTEPTMSGTMLVDNGNNMYVGVQLVVLPKSEFITPEDSPSDQSKVTAHLRLATFTFINNSISALQSDTSNKLKYIPGERVRDVSKILTDNYITKTGLNSKKLYAFAGKGTDPETGYDTWTDVTDSMIIWDAVPKRSTTKPTLKEAQFVQSPIDESISLALPHTQVDGMKTAGGVDEFYQPRYIPLPVADYDSNTPGTVDKAYTQHIKSISNKIDNFYQLVKGKQIGYLDVKTADVELPPVNQSWEVGDYYLVSQDYTADEASDSARPPVTMYVVLPGIISSIEFVTSVNQSKEVPAELTGVQLGRIDYSSSKRQDLPNTTDPEKYPIFFTEDDSIRGVVNKDYFVATYTDDNDEITYYYYKVSKSGKKEWSAYLPVTGPVPFAQETVIGGFYNVSQDATDAGYVYRDDYGRLRLVDYGLLRSGVLAYQLKEDYATPTGITTQEVQTYLNEYVNQRVAFPDEASSADKLNVINIILDLSAEDEVSTLNIFGIDSRFNTAVYLHITGTATATTTINIMDCEKIRIDSNIEGTPIINLYRSCLYYDSALIDYIRKCDSARISYTGLQDVKLWYAKFKNNDPNLLVDNMTVSELDAAITSSEVTYWNQSALNDNHYMYALHSITFGTNGDIVECSILVSDQSTNNVVSGHKLVRGEFELPQGSGLTYPISCLNKQLKVTGSFVSAYNAEGEWYVTDTNFTAVTGAYDEYTMNKKITGSIAIHSETSILSSPISSIPEWDPDSFHLFYGGAVL